MVSWTAPGSILEALGVDLGGFGDDFFEIYGRFWPCCLEHNWFDSHARWGRYGSCWGHLVGIFEGVLAGSTFVDVLIGPFRRLSMY